MKTLLFFISLTACSFAKAQTNTMPKNSPENKNSTYCMETKGDVLVLTKDGRQVYTDIKLDDGTRITTNGRIIKTDGTERLLKENECADLDGSIMKPVVETKTK